MAARLFLSVPYALARLSIWLLLLIAATVDGFAHRTLRSRGYQLYLALTIVTALFFIRNIAYLAVAAESGSDGWASNAAYGTYIFFSDTAESAWIATLLAISAGYCITRNSLGPHRGVVLTIPVIFFLTSLVVDYVMLTVVGKDAFAYSDDAYATNEDGQYDPEADPLNEVTPTTGLIFAMCAVANSMAFILSWFYMYDTARAEWEALTIPPTDPALPVAPHLPGTSDTAAGVGHSAIPTGAGALLEEGQNASHMYGDVVGEDLDAPKNVADRIADRDKATLMRQFFVGVCVYIVAAILVFFLPAFVPVGVDAALVIGYDALLWGFVAVLLFVFRMRAGNQYLSLTEDAGLDGREMTTELGVLSHDGEESPKAARQARFTLAEESDEDEAYQPMDTVEIGGSGSQQKQAAAGGGGTSAVNASAAQQGVVVRTLP